MVRRTFWQGRVARAWRQRSVVWLMGVRRVGKSVLCQSLPDIRYFLNELQAHLGRLPLHYWRNKHGNGVDFAVASRGQPPTAIECKWSSGELDLTHLRAFRGRYPAGVNFVVSADVETPRTPRFGELTVEVVSLRGLLERLTASRPPRRRRPLGGRS